MLSKGDLVLAKHYKDLLDIIKFELNKRELSTSDSVYNFNYQNQIVKAQEINFLIDKVDLLKKYDETAGLNFENQDQFIENLNLGRLNSISYNIGKVDNTNLIVAEKLNQISNVLPRHINLCVCNCNYCACNCNYCSCNQNTSYMNYCPCNCNYCACNCNYWSANRYPSLAIENTNQGLGTRNIPGEYPYEFNITSAVDTYYTTPTTFSKIYFMENTNNGINQDKYFQLRFKRNGKLGFPMGQEESFLYPNKWYKIRVENGSLISDNLGQPLFRATWGNIKMRLDVYNITDFHLYWDSKITLK